MATDALDSDSARAKDDAASQRRMDDTFGIVREVAQRMLRRDNWNRAASKYDTACVALDRVDEDYPVTDCGHPTYAMNQAIWDSVVHTKADAMHALLETPAPDGEALIRKLELLAGDDFDATPETMQHLLEDARRLFA